ncbi:winged helix-turn-helix transcriptional regulator [Venatoribacter cucullus]|uniref:Winged helix-turn-helix transcriptional regulator n=1 Tax=Venatoribacter cucullus TaxID=2661630 RepID=A0A9X7UW50_9GAMM|nr:Fic family protein [Venatoribacter cucullus]QQD24005.1 winged helix-turn-helix transcriptional regulator [Venatoribacter cucullus]
MAYEPPFTLTSEILSRVADIAEQVGRLTAQPEQGMDLRLRRVNRIRTITGSLAIEGNTLSEEQITAILNGKPVLAPPRDVQEARNALLVYEQLPNWQASHEADLLAAHKLLMTGLLDNPGQYRSGGVGVMQGDKVLHMAPPASRVRELMQQLFAWVKQSNAHPLIVSSVFHYEFEFIHPFADGNGRMGRLWQTLLLSQWHPALAWLPVESMVHEHQAAYYDAINNSNKASDAAPFVLFMLGCIQQALVAVLEQNAPVNASVNAPVNLKTPQAILQLLADNPALTRQQLADRLGKDLRTIGRAIKKLQDVGALQRRGSDKDGHWQVMNGQAE